MALYIVLSLCFFWCCLWLVYVHTISFFSIGSRLLLFWKELLPSKPNVLHAVGLFVILVIANLVFEGRMFVLILPVPGHCLNYTFYMF